MLARSNYCSLKDVVKSGQTTANFNNLLLRLCSSSQGQINFIFNCNKIEQVSRSDFCLDVHGALLFRSKVTGGLYG